MAINFPNSPNVNDQFEADGRVWKWTGTSWSFLGYPGPTNELSVGNVTTGIAGSDVEVEITGNTPEQVISFTIPRGDQGLTGDDGIVIQATEPENTDILWLDTSADDVPTSPNFVIDMNDSDNNVYTFDSVKPAGPYLISFDTPESTFDIYFLNASGQLAGYANTTSVEVTQDFLSIVILGVSTSQVVTFIYTGSVSSPAAKGTAIGAGAYLLSISPTNLPEIDDTATINGGNFATDVEIFFDSGATEIAAKNIVRNSSTQLIVTRPDNLVQDNSPYSVRAINPGVTPPTGSNVHILSNAVTAGVDPVFVTSSLIEGAFAGTAFSTTIVTTDADGTIENFSVTSGTLPPGLNLNSTTGVISGTPTTNGDYFLTITATDSGNNTVSKEFNIPVGTFLLGGTITTSGGYEYHAFTSSGTLAAKNVTGNIEYLVVAGGGGGGGQNGGGTGGGGGAGGLLSGTISNPSGDIAVAVGAGGSNNGTSSSIIGNDISVTSIGGGRGGYGFSGSGSDGRDGGSGGGGAGPGNYGSSVGGLGVVGQGNDGGGANGGFGILPGGAGGGAGEVGADSQNTPESNKGGDGLAFTTWATATGISHDGGYFAGGGGGGASTAPETNQGGLGGGGTGGGASTASSGTAGAANSGGGGGGGTINGGIGSPGGSGVVMVRMAI